MTLRFTFVFCLILATSACQQPAEVTYQNLKLFPKGKAFSGFQLTNQDGQTFDESFFKGKTTVVFFGFTNCPDICPNTLTELKKVDKTLTDLGKEKPQTLFVSVDPDRDQAENLKSYIEYFNPEFSAATGDAANILSLASQLGVAYHVEDHEADQLVYDVDHSSALFLINDQAERIGIFPAPHQAKTLAQDLTLYMESL